MNRGIARRVVFPDAKHIRVFLALLARSVRRGEIEVHAFCVLSTHFHLLVRSPRGRLSEAMRRVQNEYVRWYNRRARRDGALFRGRFLSRPVLSERYLDVLMRYIEANAVQARVVAHAEDYPHGSAYRQARNRRPLWLTTWWVDDILARARLIEPAATYVSFWCRGSSAAERALVEARMRRPPCPQDNLDDLVGSAPERVRRWMEEKARKADGGRARSPLVDPATVDRVLECARTVTGPWERRPRHGPELDLWGVARVGLLSDLGGLTHDEIATRLHVTTTLVGRRRTRHRGLMSDDDYATRVAQLGRDCLAEDHPETGLSHLLPRLSRRQDVGGSTVEPTEDHGALWRRGQPVEGGV